jgi:hypothetical protein
MARSLPLPSWAVRVTHILATIYSVCLFLTPPASARDTIHVQAPQSIQSAIDAAGPFAKIVVGPGTYAEQLLIQKDGLTLVGQGAILVPPATPVHNACSGLAGPDTQAGICVAGSGITLAPFKQEHRKVLEVKQPVKHVTVSGFQVRGFSGENIALLGAQGSQVLGNWLYDGMQYGALTAGSTNTLVGGNAVVSTGGILSIGICTDNFAGSTVSDNHVSGYFVGLCIQTSGAEIHANDMAGCCVGAYVDPRVRGAKVQHNRVSALNPLCDSQGGGAGVFLDGSLEAEVRWNLIEGMVAGGMGVGVIIVDDETVVPVAVAGGNVVEYNVLKGNDFDVFVNTTGVGNVVMLNDCDTPGGVCS